jgi:EmrB/QacA subfamily drug resistance transporter
MDITTLSPARPAGRDQGALRRWLGLVVMLSGTFMTIMDVMIANVAIPSIRRDLGASFAEAQFVLAGYGLVYALGLITGGRLGDIYGRRLLLMIGLAAFTLTSALCGLAPSPAALILARLAQGAAAAVLFPQVLSLIRVTFTEEKPRATAFAVMGVVLGLAAIAGQLLGGFLVEADLFGLAWRPVFLINIPVGALALVLAPRVIDESSSPTAGRLDVAGVVLSATGLGLLLFPLVQGREAGWPWWSFAMLAASVPVLGVFVREQHRKSQQRASPLMETALFRVPAFTTGALIVVVFYSTLNSFYLAYAFLMQVGLSCTAFETGLVFSALAVTFGGAPLLARRFASHGRRRVLIVGSFCAALGSIVLGLTAVLRAPLAPPDLLPGLAILGLGQGTVVTPLLNTILSSIRDGDVGAASGVLSTMQQVGGALGIAVVGILFFGALDGAQAGAEVYAHAFLLAALYTVLAYAVTLALLLRLPDDRPC